MKTAQISATYLDHMGSDLTVVNAARASFDKESEWDEDLAGRVLKPADAKLIRFLARGYRTTEWDALIEELRQYGRDGEYDDLERALLAVKNKAQHWAPFARPHVSIRAEMPIFLARQMVKHQVGGVWSEMSRRYVSDEPEFWFPEVWHTRPEDIKQGSDGLVENQAMARSHAQGAVIRALYAYTDMLELGVAPEEARIVLPQNTMTTVVWTGSLLFWARVCNQRLDGHAQLAAQELAKKIADIVQPLFPVSWKELVRD